MTLGDPQPLSRRQARELARDQGVHASDAHEAIPTLDVPVLAPAALRPASLGTSAHTPSSRRSSSHHTIPEPDASLKRTESVAPEAAEPAEPASPGSVSTPHTLSRRELRALQAREPSTEPEAAPADIGSADIEPADIEPAATADAELIEAELIEPEPSTPAAAPIVESEQMYAEPIAAEPIPAEPTRSDAAPTGGNAAWTPPIGHWSVDSDSPRAEAPQPDQSLDELINRGIGAGGIPTTTNALILPSIPHQLSSASPISNTGEIMITGSFDLPRSLGSTGAHPNLFDSSEMDHMMDQLDADQLGGDSAPVSASRAVSTHASTRGMLTPPKKQRASLPMILVIATAALAVSVLALFVIGYLSGAY
ncbi:hypothetical protein [Cryobacterium ruanii]|uniref:Uncharacterized protein n=1 Tax=Cryobacterium ruanii TaxID=1259197 RepID=A0A4R9AQW0_9MICO|nr:hypothetical protein [Cryobacterium ruanii]TFD68034.1 hypothetical protein E3T47_05460 [Cryobacterium ruanii]